MLRKTLPILAGAASLALGAPAAVAKAPGPEVLPLPTGYQPEGIAKYDGDEVLVGSSRERVGFDAGVRPEVTRAMLERAAAYVPALRDLPVTRAWCGFRAWLPDGLPAIGPLGDPADGLWVSTGHEGAGVGLGPVSGRLLAQLICGEPPDLDLTPFDPRRFTGETGGTHPMGETGGTDPSGLSPPSHPPAGASQR